MKRVRKSRQTGPRVPCLSALLFICLLLLPACATDGGSYGRALSPPVLQYPVSAFPKWADVLAAERELSSFGEQGLAAWKSGDARAWQALRARLQDAPLLRRAEEVNAFFNRWPFIEDADNWGAKDYWALPREFAARSGDCEDYAVAKYFALRDLGVPADSLRIAGVLDSRRRNAEHAVLLVFTEGGAYVLDNQVQDLRAQADTRRYRSVYYVNEEHLWLWEPLPEGDGEPAPPDR